MKTYIHKSVMDISISKDTPDVMLLFTPCRHYGGFSLGPGQRVEDFLGLWVKCQSCDTEGRILYIEKTPPSKHAPKIARVGLKLLDKDRLELEAKIEKIKKGEPIDIFGDGEHLQKIDDPIVLETLTRDLENICKQIDDDLQELREKVHGGDKKK